VQTRRQQVLFIIGMSFYWMCLRRSYFGILFSAHPSLGLNSQAYYLIFIIFVSVLAILAVLKAGFLQNLLAGKPVSVLLATIPAAISSACIFISPQIGPAEIPVTLALTFLLAVGFIAMTFSWALRAISGELRAVTVCAISSFILSFALSFLQLTVMPVPALLVVLAPAASGLAWFLSRGDSTTEAVSKDAGINRGRLGLIGILIAFLLAGAVMRGLVYSGAINYTPAVDAVLGHLVSIGLSLMMLLMVLAVHRREKLFDWIWIILAILFFAGLFLLASFNSEWQSVGDSVLIAGRTCLGFFLWVTLVQMIKIRRISAVWGFGLFFVLTEMASAFLTYFVVPGMLAVLGMSFEGYTSVIAIGMALILIAASFLFLNNRAYASEEYGPGRIDGKTGEAMVNAGAEGAATPPLPDYVQSICGQIADTGNLTGREREVLVLLARGNSKNRIAETLFVSEGTVQTHTKSIYRKLGLHSRQELIDMVDAWSPDTDTIG
jgi:DNA-binding CsgD family transcriptional regulator